MNDLQEQIKFVNRGLTVLSTQKHVPIGGILALYSMLLYVPTFQRNVLPPSSCYLIWVVWIL